MNRCVFRYSAIGEVYRRWFFFFQAEDGIRDLVRSRGLGDVYKRQLLKDGAIGLFRAFLVLEFAGKLVVLLRVQRVAQHLSLIHI